MKKMANAIPVAVILGLLTCLFVFMCLPRNQKNVLAVDGQLDLRGERMEGTVFPLNGAWHFYYGALLGPEDFTAAIPQTQTIEVPASWSHEGYPLNGYATYRLVIRTDNDKTLLMYLPEIGSAYSLWVNGEALRSTGVVANRPDQGRLLMENTLIPVVAENGVIDLVIQTSNYHNSGSGLIGALQLGESDAVYSDFLRTRALYCVALGGILMTALYHLALFIFRRQEKSHLIFSITCLVCFANFLLGANGLNSYFQWAPMSVLLVRFTSVLFFLYHYVLTIFWLNIFSRRFLLSHKGAFIAYLAIGIAFFSLMPMNISSYPLVNLFSVIPICLFVTIMTYRSPVLRQKQWTWLYFATMLVYISLACVFKVFIGNILFMPGLFISMFLILFQSLVLSKEYTNAFRIVEETNENLERIVDDRTRDLQGANSAMKELIGNISHDLKTPLAVMSVHLEQLNNLSQTQLDDEYQRHVRVVYQKNLDLQRLIQNLIEISRIESGHSLYKPDWVSLSDLLSQAQNKYDDFLRNKDIFFEIYSLENVEIYIDPQRIWSVFDNIIYNAARYTGQGGAITINAKALEKTVIVTITDNGCGIAPEHLPHIFDRFYKASASRGMSAGDSGLGLYIVKSIMEALNGSVGAQSKPGQGTSIILSFQKNTN